MKYLLVFCLIVCLAVSGWAFSGGMPGGLSPYPVKEAQKHLSLIEKHYNEQTNDDNYGVVAKIESAQSQVVAGQRLVIKYTLNITDCKKQEVLKGLRASGGCNQTKVSSGASGSSVASWPISGSDANRKFSFSLPLNRPSDRAWPTSTSVPGRTTLMCRAISATTSRPVLTRIDPTSQTHCSAACVYLVRWSSICSSPFSPENSRALRC